MNFVFVESADLRGNVALANREQKCSDNRITGRHAGCCTDL